jgi:hypothetical protein
LVLQPNTSIIKLKCPKEQFCLSRKLQPTLQLELKPSRRLIHLLVVIHILALAASIANSLPIAVKLALMTWICLHFYFVINSQKGRIKKIRHSETLGWELSDNSNFKKIKIKKTTVITIFAIFLHFSDDAHEHTALIVNDALSEDDYRRLIVRLKTANKP